MLRLDVVRSHAHVWLLRYLNSIASFAKIEVSLYNRLPARLRRLYLRSRKSAPDIPSTVRPSEEART